MSSRAKFMLSLLGLFLAVTPATAQNKFTLEMSGMLAFVKTKSSSLVVLLPNQRDEIGSASHLVHHAPWLFVRCDDIDDPILTAACVGSQPDPKNAIWSIALDSGVDVSFEFGGSSKTLDVDTSASEVIWDLPDLLASSKPLAGRVRPELLGAASTDPAGFRKLAIARVSIDGGKLEGSQGYLQWSFGVPKQTPLKEHVYDPDFFRLTREVPAGGMKIVLESYDAKSRLVLPMKDQLSVQVELSHEPDIAEYCSHPPSKAHPESVHFRRFYDLTQVAAAEIPKLPLTIAEDFPVFCGSLTLRWGKRVNCDTVFMEP